MTKLANNAERMITWCRMWSEDPALAHELMTGDCVQWSGQTPGLDTVVGPAEQEEFITKYRAQHLNNFTPRVLVDGGSAFAYTWDVATPGGGVKTGLDVNILSGDRIRENWTFVAPGHCDTPDPGPDETPATQDLVGQWLRGEGSGAVQLFSGTAGPVPNGPRKLHRDPILAPGRAAFLWTAPDGTTGADVLALRAGRISQAWSLTGSRAFRY
jgi:hypothetical protein